LQGIVVLMELLQGRLFIHEYFTVKFYSYTKFGIKLLESFARSESDLLTDRFQNSNSGKLVIITPHPTNLVNIWGDIHNAWQKIRSSNSAYNMKSWRTILKYGEEIIPGQRLFRLKNSSPQSFFYLLEETDLSDAFLHIFDIFGVLCSLIHIHSGRAFLHAASVFQKSSAYLLLGHSGAGKSTASEYSLEKQYSVLHDDHVVVFKSNQGEYGVTNNTFSVSSVRLKALLFLMQDKKDYLVPLSPIETTKRLMEGSFESFSSPLLYGKFLKTVFNISSGMAHSIPGYELHFRKSPDFWDMIDEELKN